MAVRRSGLSPSSFLIRSTPCIAVEWSRLKLSPIFGVGSMLVSSLLGGFTSAKSHRKNGLIMGVVTGLIFVLLISIAALISKSAIHTTMFLCCGIIGVILSSLGGIIGVSEKKRKRTRRGFWKSSCAESMRKLEQQLNFHQKTSYWLISDLWYNMGESRARLSF